MNAKEYIIKSRFTVIILDKWEQVRGNEPKPKYHVKATDEFGSITYNIYSDSKAVIKAYVKVSPYNLHIIS